MTIDREFANDIADQFDIAEEELNGLMTISMKELNNKLKLLDLECHAVLNTREVFSSKDYSTLTTKRICLGHIKEERLRLLRNERVAKMAGEYSAANA